MNEFQKYCWLKKTRVNYQEYLEIMEEFLDVISVLKYWRENWPYLIIHLQWIISLPLLIEHLCMVNKFP